MQQLPTLLAQQLPTLLAQQLPTLLAQQRRVRLHGALHKWYYNEQKI